MKYDILSVYGDVKLKQNICQKCKSKFFILDKADKSIYCPDCRKINEGEDIKHPEKPTIIYHSPLYKRKYIPKKIRLAVYKRDNYTCVYCDKYLYDDFILASGNITVDHFVPYIGRGEGEIKNLVTACKKCNSAKYSKLFGTIEEVRDFIEKKKIAKRLRASKK